MREERHYYVYIITNEWNTTLYIGVTNNLLRRIQEHKNGVNESFSKRYHLTKLVYFEEGGDISGAIAREKQLKRWHRDWKMNLIRQQNPTFRDLSAGMFGEGFFK
ncbi:MAG: GIY-YIG nuclease family protein [Candidatus Kerfeldbacteria bacterium]|nr:GIY-YIG nuclease family protein [Candidatus Kerfeldbacteria bacterium]